MKFSTKQLKLNKSNTQVIIMISAASSIIAFSLVGSRALLNQRAYQSRVIAGKTKANEQLIKNVKAVKQLATSYNDFVSQSTNIIGGSLNGQGDRDGDNAKIILDALPSQYDFPALATSLDKLLNVNGVTIGSLSGSDDELAQSKITGTADPLPIALPLSVGGSGSYGAIQALFDTVHRSIRPIEVDTMALTGSDSAMSFTFNGQTYYQPSKTLDIKKTVIK